MVLRMLFDEYLGLSETAAMIFAGAVLALLGAGHVLMPASSTVGGLLGAGSGIMDLAGIATRVIGAFVFAAGIDILGEAY